MFSVLSTLEIYSSTTEPERTGIDDITRFFALDYSRFVGDICSSGANKKAGPFLTSRSLNVLKKSEKGLLTEYQRSFSFWKKSSATGRCFTD